MNDQTSNFFDYNIYILLEVMQLEMSAASWFLLLGLQAISGAVHGSQQRRKRCQGHSVVVPWCGWIYTEQRKNVGFIGRLWKNWHRFETIPLLRLLGSWTVKYDFKLLLCSNIGTYMCIYVYIYIYHWEPKLWNGRISWIGIDKYKFYLPEDGAYSWWQLCVISPLAFRHQCPSTGPAPGYCRS